MENDLPRYYRGKKAFGVRCKAIPIPPEERRKGQHLPEYYEDLGLRPPLRPAQWLIPLGCSLVSLALGLLAGYLLFA
jgi:hypothetical protein